MDERYQGVLKQKGRNVYLKTVGLRVRIQASESFWLCAYFLRNLQHIQNGERRLYLNILRGYHRGAGMLAFYNLLVLALKMLVIAARTGRIPRTIKTRICS